MGLTANSLSPLQGMRDSWIPQAAAYAWQATAVMQPLAREFVIASVVPMVGAASASFLARALSTSALLVPEIQVAGLVGSFLFNSAYTFLKIEQMGKMNTANALVCAVTNSLLTCVPAMVAEGVPFGNVLKNGIIGNALLGTLSLGLEAFLSDEPMTRREIARQWLATLGLGTGTALAFHVLGRLPLGAMQEMILAGSPSNMGARGGREARDPRLDFTHFSEREGARIFEFPIHRLPNLPNDDSPLPISDPNLLLLPAQRKIVGEVRRRLRLCRAPGSTENTPVYIESVVVRAESGDGYELTGRFKGDSIEIHYRPCQGIAIRYSPHLEERFGMVPSDYSTWRISPNFVGDVETVSGFRITRARRGDELRCVPLAFGQCSIPSIACADASEGVCASVKLRTPNKTRIEFSPMGASAGGEGFASHTYSIDGPNRAWEKCDLRGTKRMHTWYRSSEGVVMEAEGIASWESRSRTWKLRAHVDRFAIASQGILVERVEPGQVFEERRWRLHSPLNLGRALDIASLDARPELGELHAILSDKRTVDISPIGIFFSRCEPYFLTRMGAAFDAPDQVVHEMIVQPPLQGEDNRRLLLSDGHQISVRTSRAFGSNLSPLYTTQFSIGPNLRFLRDPPPMLLIHSKNPLSYKIATVRPVVPLGRIFTAVDIDVLCQEHPIRIVLSEDGTAQVFYEPTKQHLYTLVQAEGGELSSGLLVATLRQGQIELADRGGGRLSLALHAEQGGIDRVLIQSPVALQMVEGHVATFKGDTLHHLTYSEDATRFEVAVEGSHVQLICLPYITCARFSSAQSTVCLKNGWGLEASPQALRIRGPRDETLVLSANDKGGYELRESLAHVTTVGRAPLHFVRDARGLLRRYLFRLVSDSTPHPDPELSLSFLKKDVICELHDVAGETVRVMYSPQSHPPLRFLPQRGEGLRDRFDENLFLYNRFIPLSIWVPFGEMR